MIELMMHESFSSINEKINLLSESLYRKGFKERTILCINNDIVVAGLISKRINVPVVQVLYGDINGVYKRENDFPIISLPIRSGYGKLPEFPKLIFATLCYSSNEEQKRVISYYQNVGHEITIVCPFYRPQHEPKTPEIIYESLIHDETKILTPFGIV